MKKILYSLLNLNKFLFYERIFIIIPEFNLFYFIFSKCCSRALAKALIKGGILGSFISKSPKSLELELLSLFSS